MSPNDKLFYHCIIPKIKNAFTKNMNFIIINQFDNKVNFHGVKIV